MDNPPLLDFLSPDSEEIQEIKKLLEELLNKINNL